MSTISSNLNATDTVNLTQLSQNSPIGENSVWILVEGDDDCKIYPKFFQKEKCKIEQVHGGVGQLEIALNKLQQYADRIAGIRDADFCHLSGKHSSLKNLFYTDCHDIEMTMIQNDTVLENILYEYSLQSNIADIKQNILNEASYVGYTKYYNDVNNCSINFEGITFGKIVTLQGDNLFLQKSSYLQNLNERSPRKTISIDENTVNQFIASNPIHDLYQLVNGHDFIKLLALRINFHISKGIPEPVLAVDFAHEEPLHVVALACSDSRILKRLQHINHKDVSKSLRNSYRIDDFKLTNLYNCLLLWQNMNGLDILAQSQIITNGQ
ncbi:MAG: DUF4435 domain-containing protein [Planctomycetaceae bacterium]|jgi:hypothetical protein|nr:DUF4435 domain-containing protein [Planctomycetaceae bacterium]